jgi:hypothetical protein
VTVRLGTFVEDGSVMPPTPRTPADNLMDASLLRSLSLTAPIRVLGYAAWYVSASTIQLA